MRSIVLRSSALCALALFSLPVSGPAQTQIKKTPINRTPVDSGASMYFNYCASCHSADGKGGGPAAKAVKMPIPDLTLLSKNNNGEFPSMSVLMTLGRIRGSGPHGSADMPIWGDVFRASGSHETEAQLRLYNITRFVESLQVPAPRQPKPVRSDTRPLKVTDVSATSGSAMYAAMCASCHGARGRGDGPSASALLSMPTDLTTLASNNNGSFPGAKVAYILGSNPGTAAHGSAEMPIWGDVFRAVESNQAIVKLRIANLVDHVKSLQR